MPPSPLLKSFWAKLFPNPLYLFAILFLVLTWMRGYGYFASDLFNGIPVMASFLLMWLVPIVFLSKTGQVAAGIRRPESKIWILYAVFIGAALAFTCHFLGLALFGKGDQHWFTSVAYAYQSDFRLSYLERERAFLVFTIPALLASPFGEELFFRGALHAVVRERYTERIAMLATAFLFAAVHLMHHGVYRNHDGIAFMPLSGMLWFFLMFGTSIVFTFLRRKANSIWAPILAHSAFNLAMNVTIFYSLLVAHPQRAI